MKRFIRFQIIIILLLSGQFLAAQNTRSGFRQTAPQRQQNKLEVFQWFMPDSTQQHYILQLYINIPNNFLNFIQEDSGFVAKYELTVNILNAEHESIAGKISKQKRHAANFTEANSHRKVLNQKFNFNVTPGKWQVFIEVMDGAAATPHRETRKLILPEMKPLMVTAPLFFYTQSDSNDSAPQTPILPPVAIQGGPAIESRFLLTAPLHTSPVHLYCAVVNTQGDTTKFFRHTVNIRQNRQWVRIPLDDALTFGEYQLHISAQQNLAMAHAQGPFWIQWAHHSKYVPALFDAATVLKYIMDKDQYNAFMAMPDTEKEEALSRFWKERDPTPETVINELEEEYYKRVEFANQHFMPWSQKTSGWKSARGRVYILYGPPTQVERPPLSSGSQRQYEIWHYQTLNRKFLFVDRYGNGDYILYSQE